jgi:hypothetical protein
MGVQIFTLTEASVMQDKNKTEEQVKADQEKYGFTYWAKAQGVDYPLRFNSFEQLGGFETISAEEAAIPMGKSYMQLRKVKVATSSQAQAVSSSADTKTEEPSPMQAQMLNQARKPLAGDLEEINRKLDLILQYVEPIDKVVPLDDGEKIDLDGIPF